MTLVFSDQKTKETAWVCLCDQHCVAGGFHGGSVWNPALTLMPGDSHAHSAIWGALAILKKMKRTVSA
jgi:hypothetical protein